MKVVWKYRARPEAFGLGLPVGAQVVYFDVQEHIPTLWVLVDTDAAPHEQRLFWATGTGSQIPENSQHIGSCIDRERELVWHLFEPQSP